MKYRTLPRTDLEVSVIGLGTMTWGEQNTQAEAFEQMDYALEQGVTLFDTAEMYPVPPRAETYSRTETIIGNWFAERGTEARDKVVLATKVAGPSVHAKHIRDGQSRLNRSNIEAALEESLRRLQTDHIDLYQLHWPDRPVPLFGTRDYSHPRHDESVPIEETLEALEAIRESGKVRHFGLSNETPWGAMRFLQLAEERGWPRVVTIQNAYNLLNRTFDAGLSEICHREDLRLLAYSPLAFGKLSGKYLGGARPRGARITVWDRFSRYEGPNADAAIEGYVEIAREAGLDAAQMALAFINRREYVASNLIGATSMDQLRSNIESIDVELSGEVRRRIDRVHSRYPNPCP